MKVLLVNPYIYDFTAYDLWLRPLGLLYIAAVLKEYTNCELHWLDTLDRFQNGAFAEDDPALKDAKASGRGKYHREIVTRPKIYKSIPRPFARYGIPLDTFRQKLQELPEVDIILIATMMTYWHEGVQFTITQLRQRFPKAKIVVGGILPSLVSSNTLKSSIDADYFISGYGEEKVLNLIKDNGGKVNPHPDFSHLDQIPFPAVEFLSNTNTLPLMTSRGCPYRCTYCASAILNEKFKERDPEKILEEIYYHHQTFGTRHFVIFDDALLINKETRFLKVFGKVSRELKVKFHTPNGLHAGEIDRETAELFFKSGFKALRLSFESTTAEILSKSSGKVKVSEMVRAVENLIAAGYKKKDIAVYLLFGIPGQQLKQLEKDFLFVKNLGVKPHLSYFSPVPGTKDFKKLQENGILSNPVDLYETNKIYFLYKKSNFTLEEIKYIKKQALNLQMPKE